MSPMTWYGSSQFLPLTWKIWQVSGSSALIRYPVASFRAVGDRVRCATCWNSATGALMALELMHHVTEPPPRFHSTRATLAFGAEVCTYFCTASLRSVVAGRSSALSMASFSSSCASPRLFPLGAFSTPTAKFPSEAGRRNRRTCSDVGSSLHCRHPL